MRTGGKNSHSAAQSILDVFPLPDNERKAKNFPGEDESEEELIESILQDKSCCQKPGSEDGSEQELIEDATGHSEQCESTRKCQREMKPKQQTDSSPRNQRQLTTCTKDARQELVENLKASIAEKSEAEAKKRKMAVHT